MKTYKFRCIDRLTSRPISSGRISITYDINNSTGPDVRLDHTGAAIIDINDSHIGETLTISTNIPGYYDNQLLNFPVDNDLRSNEYILIPLERESTTNIIIQVPIQIQVTSILTSQPINNTSVQLTNIISNQIINTQTGVDGISNIFLLPGNYILKISKPGFNNYNAMLGVDPLDNPLIQVILS